MGRLTLVAAVAVVAFTGAALCSPSFVISGDERIGTFAVRKDGTLGGLQATGRYPGLQATFARGTVASFSVSYGAGGE